MVEEKERVRVEEEEEKERVRVEEEEQVVMLVLLAVVVEEAMVHRGSWQPRRRVNRQRCRCRSTVRRWRCSSLRCAGLRPPF